MPVGGGQVDHALGDVRKLLVGVLLLVERLFQQVGGVVAAELLRPRHQRAVPRDLVVLDFIGGGDQAGILDGVLGAGAQDVLAFRDQPFHGFARLALGLHAHHGEDLFESLDVPLRFFEVRLEARPQVFGRGRLGHFRQRLDQLLLGIVQVAEFR